MEKSKWISDIATIMANHIQTIRERRLMCKFAEINSLNLNFDTNNFDASINILRESINQQKLVKLVKIFNKITLSKIEVPSFYQFEKDMPDNDNHLLNIPSTINPRYHQYLFVLQSKNIANRITTNEEWVLICRLSDIYLGNLNLNGGSISVTSSVLMQSINQGKLIRILKLINQGFDMNIDLPN